MTATSSRNALLFLTFTTYLVAQGPLDPPSGVPSPGMKTLQEVFDEVKDLDQIEPRTPISSLPFTIDVPGSYYLTGNLTTEGVGISITSSKVSLDLNGFTLEGTGSGSHYAGIKAERAANSLTGLEIKNGIIIGFGNCIEFRSVSGSSITNVHCSGSSRSSLQLNGNGSRCSGNSISHCQISNSGNYGISLSSAAPGECSGNTIAHCLVTDCVNGGIGLFSGTGQTSGNVIANNVVRNITSTQETASGIRLAGAKENRVEENHVSGIFGGAATTTYGIYSQGTNPRNLIIKNSCAGADNNFLIHPADTHGPIITTSGAITSNNPWANFSH